MREACGISICAYDPATGAVFPGETIAPDVIVGVGVFGRKHPVYYCADESMRHPDFREGGGGRVLAFVCDRESGALTYLNEQPACAAGTSYLALDREEQYLVATTFGSGTPVTRPAKNENGEYVPETVYGASTTNLYRINEDGSIGKLCDVIVHPMEGTRTRPVQPHMHSVSLAPLGDFFAVCDMGTDKVYTFRINHETEKLEACPGSPFQSEAGMGCRYHAFHPTQPYLIVNNEHRPYLTSFRYEPDGRLIRIGDYRILQEAAEPKTEDEKVTETETPTKTAREGMAKQSGMAMTADGQYVYTLARGTNTVSAFRVEEGGELTLVQSLPYGGDMPKGCSVSPDGRFLLVASRGSKDVITLAIREDGTLSETGISTTLPSPAVVTFLL